jgi:hypothetical protein
MGLALTMKADLAISSLKSTVAPSSSASELPSTTTRAPSFSKILRAGDAPTDEKGGCQRHVVAGAPRAHTRRGKLLQGILTRPPPHRR